MFEDLLTNALDAIWVVDEDGIIRYLNPAAAVLSGYSRESLVGQPLARILPPDIADAHTGFLQHYKTAGPQFHIMDKVREFSIVARDGEAIPVGLRAFEIPPLDDKRRFGAIMQDNRPRRKLEAERDALLARLSALALEDDLTGLPNRRAFLEELQRAQAAARRNGDLAFLAVLDIDYFKRVNDTFGHAIGDLTLRAITKACSDTLRGEDFLARVGGEEFALVIRQANPAGAVTVAERMRARVENTAVRLPDGREVRVTVSIGVAPLSPDGAASDSLKAADQALYEAKDSGRNRVYMAHQEQLAAASA